ncbi:Ig-like domain-containing protein [Bacillus sp. EB01]|uniref:Ig-like domain-containing protein n=1 Tax=Bacillus sp. EB01 TaxID=1347086 RepID=UPI0005C7481D|nr:Ig-like domain-containing protein [Bacillus sp. EB01]
MVTKYGNNTINLWFYGGIFIKKRLLVLLTAFCILFTCFSNIPVKASISNDDGSNVVDTISVEKKNILVPNLQEVRVTIKNNNGIGYIGGSYTGVQYMTVSYKLPSGSYMQVRLSRNNVSESTFYGYAYTNYSDVGTLTVANITQYFYSGGFRVYFDKDEGGKYELDEGNYTVFASDTIGPELKGASVSNTKLAPDQSIILTLDAEDQLGSIESVSVQYSLPNGGGLGTNATYIGNNQFQVTMYASILQNYGYGKYELESVRLTDNQGNSTVEYDYSAYNYSTRSLDGGDFTFIPEENPPTLKSITVEDNDVFSGDPVTLIAEVEDASGVSEVKANFKTPLGYSHTEIFTHWYGNYYKAEVPGFWTQYHSIGSWKVQFIYLNDTYGNSTNIWNYNVYPYWGQDLSAFDFYVNERDVTPPSSPSVSTVDEYSNYIYGNAEANSTVTAKVNGNTIGSGTADNYGYYSIYIPRQVAHTEIYITATDASGNESQATTVIVSDVTPPGKVSVEEVYDSSSTITGYAEGNSLVKVEANGVEIGSNYAYWHGWYYVYIPQQPAGTELTVTATDSSGNTSEGTTITVKDGTAPSNPSVNEVTDKDTKVTGYTETGATIEIHKDGTVLGSSTADDNGAFSIEIPKQDAGTPLFIYARDVAGNQSSATEIVVQDATAPSISLDPITDQSLAITGTTEIDATVSADIKGTIYTTTANSDGKFELQIPKQAAGERISVTVSDGRNTSQPVVVTVLDVTPPVVEGVTDGSFYNKDVSISFNEGTATLNGETYEWGTVIKSEGTYILVVTDDTGNQTTVKFTIDKTPPKVMGVVNNSSYRVDVTPTFNEGNAALNGSAYKSGTVIKDEGSYTLVVTDLAGNKTIVKFAIDKTAPVVSGIKNNTYYNTDVIPSFTEGTATLNGVAFKSGNVVSVEGAYTLIVTDSAGNKTTITFTIDKIAPVVTGIENDTHYNTNVTPSFNEGVTSLNGISFTSGTEIKLDGFYTLVVTDRAGNKTTVKFTVDKIAPVITGVENNKTYTSAITPAFNEGTATLNGENFESGTAIKVDGTYTLVVTDKAGNQSTVKFIIDLNAPLVSGVENSASYNKDVTPTFEEGTATLNGSPFKSGEVIKAEGDYTLVVTDGAGNKTTVKFTIDKSAPVISGVENNKVYKSEVTPTFNEGTATLNGSAFSKGKVISSDGAYTLVVTDKAGNTSTVKFTIDKTAPKVTGVTNNAYYNRDITVLFNEGAATLNGAAFKSGAVVKNPGVYTLVVTDLAGNKTTVKFTIDKTVPKVTGVTNNGFYNRDVKVTFNEGKATLNGVTFVSGNVVKAAKVYTLVVTDAAGNKTTVKFTIDKAAPKVTGVANNAYYNKDVRVYFNEGKATLNGVAFKSGTVVKTAKAYTLVVTDSAGNKTTVKFTIDRTPPAAPKVNAVKSGSKTVTGTAEAYSVVTIKVGTKVIGKATTDRYGKYKVTIPAQKRNTALYVTAKDRAGNVSKATKTVVK